VAVAKQISVDYRDLGFGEARPYLFLHLSGINDRDGVVPGLIDTGADATVLPAGYAPLMGYSTKDVTHQQGTQVGGSLNMWQAIKPATAHIPEIPEVTFEFRPVFVQGCRTALWGRKDFLQIFDLTVIEREQRFILTYVGAENDE
jgi:hypothetical protein